MRGVCGGACVCDTHGFAGRRCPSREISVLLLRPASRERDCLCHEICIHSPIYIFCVRVGKRDPFSYTDIPLTREGPVTRGEIQQILVARRNLASIKDLAAELITRGRRRQIQRRLQKSARHALDPRRRTPWDGVTPFAPAEVPTVRRNHHQQVGVLARSLDSRRKAEARHDRIVVSIEQQQRRADLREGSEGGMGRDLMRGPSE